MPGFPSPGIFLYTNFMEEESSLQELQKLVSQCEASILYKPLKDEINYDDRSFPLEVHKNNLILPYNKNSKPFEWATKCITKFRDAKPYILIPGTRFDIHGTRHGKGGGWYDRFLSKIPSQWLRIGVVDKSQMSNTQLLKQGWDEPVDWIIAHDGYSWSVYKAQAL